MSQHLLGSDGHLVDAHPGGVGHGVGHRSRSWHDPDLTYAFGSVEPGRVVAVEQEHPDRGKVGRSGRGIVQQTRIDEPALLIDELLGAHDDPGGAVTALQPPTVGKGLSQAGCGVGDALHGAYRLVHPGREHQAGGYGPVADQHRACAAVAAAGSPALRVPPVAPVYAAETAVGQEFRARAAKDGLKAALTWRRSQFDQ